MLYDPKWEKEIETDKEYAGVSLRKFIAWLETMPANQEYNYANPWSCAVGQYLNDSGRPGAGLGVSFIKSCMDETDPGRWLWEIAAGVPRTFGAALKRARARL